MRLWTAACVPGDQSWLATASVLAGVGCTVPGRDAFVGIPLVDTQKVAPAGVAGTDVGTPTSDLHRRVSFGNGGQAVLATEGEALSAVEH